MPTEAGPDKLSIVVFSGDFDKVHYALVLASGAAAIGKAVTLFFTMEASRALMKPGADGRPAWRALPVASPAWANAGAMDDAFAARGVATFEELLAACPELGVRFLVCEMGLKAMDLSRDHLRDDIPVEDGGVVTFVTDASATGAVLFI
ncbi:MAG: DsrE/DsrF/DrsH-like family protein [Rhodospirillales bacterium]|jgi:peroxiredoxin family protein|nr:DsrE/DsrF/DrsH-like family protein [Rhodospirillales bacterium]